MEAAEGTGARDRVLTPWYGGARVGARPRRGAPHTHPGGGRGGGRGGRAQHDTHAPPPASAVADRGPGSRSGSGDSLACAAGLESTAAGTGRGLARAPSAPTGTARARGAYGKLPRATEGEGRAADRRHRGGTCASDTVRGLFTPAARSGGRASRRGGRLARNPLRGAAAPSDAGRGNPRPGGASDAAAASTEAYWSPTRAGHRVRCLTQDESGPSRRG